jgi:hypothetical protein
VLKNSTVFFLVLGRFFPANEMAAFPVLLVGGSVSGTVSVLKVKVTRTPNTGIHFYTVYAHYYGMNSIGIGEETIHSYIHLALRQECGLAWVRVM